MSKITIETKAHGSVELELDLLDADEYERLLNLTDELNQKLQNPTTYAGLSGPDAIRTQCRAIESFFDRFFGSGTSEKLFAGKDKNHLGAHLNAFARVAEEGVNAGKNLNGLADKYGFERVQNREQRRKQERNSNKKTRRNRGGGKNR